MSDDDWESFRDGELDPAAAARLVEVVRSDPADADLALQRALTAWSAACRAGDVKRAFLARIGAESQARPLSAPPVATSSSPSVRGSRAERGRRAGSARASTTRIYHRRQTQSPAQGWIAAVAAGLMIVVVGWVLMSTPSPKSVVVAQLHAPGLREITPEAAPENASTFAPPELAQTAAIRMNIHDASPGMVTVAGQLMDAPNAPMTLPAQTALTVAAGGQVTLALGPSRIVVGHPREATTVEWSSSDAGPLRWHLDYGSLALTVIRDVTERAWSVQVPQAEIAVVGTVFSVHAAPDQWSVAVQHGAVSALLGPPAGQGIGVPGPTRVSAGMTLVGTAEGLRLLPHADVTARRAVLITDKLHADDAAAIGHALLSPDLEVVAIVTTWDGNQQADLAAWCQELITLLGRDRVQIAQGLAAPLTAVAASPSPAAQVLRQAAATATTNEPLLVISLGTSRTVLGEALRLYPELADRMQLIEFGFAADQPYGLGSDPLADAICAASALRQLTALVDQKTSLAAWPDGPFGALLARSGPATTGQQVDVVGVSIAEQLARGRPLPAATASAELVAAMTARWQERGPQALTPRGHGLGNCE